MKDQHEKIKGYRNLSIDEINLINEGKQLAERCGEYIAKLEEINSNDQQCINLGKTNLKQGFMWITRGISQPTAF